MTVLAIIGLVLGLVVFALVVKLLNDTLTPLRAVLADVQNAKTAPMRGRNEAAIASCTSSDSAALHGLYFCVFALSVTRRESSRSALAST